jgi:hypothetical protein
MAAVLVVLVVLKKFVRLIVLLYLLFSSLVLTLATAVSRQQQRKYRQLLHMLECQFNSDSRNCVLPPWRCPLSLRPQLCC